jgi:shikimate kinase
LPRWTGAGASWRTPPIVTPEAGRARRHVVLIGLPGAGKSAAGRVAAGLLDAAFTDLDRMIVLETGRSIPELFADPGEAGFRDLERAAMGRVLVGAPQVVAPGGGWAAQPGNLDAAAGAFLVHLRVSPEVAAARLEQERDRPLLQGDPQHRLERLWRERERFYLRAHAEVDTDAMSPVLVAEAVAKLARREAGWRDEGRGTRVEGRGTRDE